MVMRRAFDVKHLEQLVITQELTLCMIYIVQLSHRFGSQCNYLERIKNKNALTSVLDTHLIPGIGDVENSANDCNVLPKI